VNVDKVRVPLSFRHKVLLSQIVLCALLVSVVFPFIEKMVYGILHRSLEESGRSLIEIITKDTKSPEELVEKLKNQEYSIFFRASLLNKQGEVIYDSHLERFFGKEYIPFCPSDHPEVAESLKKGVGFAEGYSQIFSHKFAYVAIAFIFQGKTYVLRIAFPFNQVQELVYHFKVAFVVFALALLLLFTAFMWLIFFYFTRPIEQIIGAIKTYRGESRESLPHITLKSSLSEKDDFYRLAKTLNSLSDAIRMQMEALICERNEKEAILESLGEGVIAVDASMQVTYVNGVGSRMLGIPKRYLLHKAFPKHSDKPQAPLLEKCEELLDAVQKEGSALSDSISMGDTRKIYLDLIAAPKIPGGGAILVLQDKSSHYKVLEMGKDFVANASHELRTPITIIKGFAETLQEMPELSFEVLTDITEKIVRSCERMDKLVKNLLTLADIENLPESRFQPCDLLGLVQECIHILLSKYPDVHIEFEEQEEVILPADADLLELAISNLLDNAVKYSRGAVHITIQMRVSTDEVHLTICDKGIGIPASDVEHIFERFYTVDKAHTRKLGGAGLGLSIVKTIVEKHDGTINVTSVLGQGSCFTITLPRERFRR